MATTENIKALQAEAQAFAESLRGNEAMRSYFRIRNASTPVSGMATATDVDTFAANLSRMKSLAKRDSMTDFDALLPIIKSGEDIRDRWRAAEKAWAAEQVLSPEYQAARKEQQEILERASRLRDTLQFIASATDKELADICNAFAYRIENGGAS